MERKFKVGDFVKNDTGNIGIVEWTENKCINCKPDDGYLGINLLTGTRGFQAPVHEKICTKSSIDEAIKHWQNEVREANCRAWQTQCRKSEYEKLVEENRALKRLVSIFIDSE